MKTKIKKMDLEKAGGHKIVNVVLEKSGKEYTFTAKAIDVVDKDRFKGLLRFWTEKAIPEREMEEGMTDEVIKGKLVKIMAPETKE